MKMLKKLAALILAGAMVLVLFTACGDPTPTQEQQAEAQAMSAINASRPAEQKLENNAQRRAVANQNIDAAAKGNWGLFGFDHKFYLDDSDIKNGKFAFTYVAKYDYQNTKLADLVDKITQGDTKVESNSETDWSEIGVVVKTVNGQTYIAVSVLVDTNGRG